ncbi:hypothetical protein J1N35_034762, partial [Gossypium stocksii]
SRQNYFTKLIPKFPTFTTSLLSIPKAAEELGQTLITRVESVNLGTTSNEGETIVEKPTKMPSLNIKNKEE